MSQFCSSEHLDGSVTVMWLFSYKNKPFNIQLLAVIPALASADCSVALNTLRFQRTREVHKNPDPIMATSPVFSCTPSHATHTARQGQRSGVNTLLSQVK